MKKHGSFRFNIVLLQKTKDGYNLAELFVLYTSAWLLIYLLSRTDGTKDGYNLVELLLDGTCMCISLYNIYYYYYY